MITRDTALIGLGVVALGFAAWQALMQEDELTDRLGTKVSNWEGSGFTNIDGVLTRTYTPEQIAASAAAAERVRNNPPPAYRDYANLPRRADGTIIGGL